MKEDDGRGRRAAPLEAGLAPPPATRAIKTEHVYPPIPLRQFDWRAWFEDDEHDAPCGWGKTEAEAIQDLKDLNA